MHRTTIQALVLGAALAGAASPALSQACATERLASPIGAIENEFGWSLDRDGDRFLITAPEERAVDPITGQGWGDDGGAYVVDLLPSGQFGLPQHLQWDANSVFELGRYGALDGEFVVLAERAFPWAVDELFAFRDGPQGFAPEGVVSLPQPAGFTLGGAGFDVENARLMVLVTQTDSSLGTSSSVLHTYLRSSGAWSLFQSLDLNAAGAASGLGREVKAEGDRLYVTFSSGELHSYSWTSTGWSPGAFLTVTQPGVYWGGHLDVQGGRIVSVGGQSGALLLHSVLDSGGVLSLESPGVLPSTALEPSSVAVSGSRAAVGFHTVDLGVGEVILLDDSSGSWQVTQTLRAAVPEARDWYGRGLCFTGDGRLLVGAPQNADGGETDRGFVEVVEFEGANCAGLLVHPSSVSLSGFGAPVETTLVGPSSVGGLSYVVLFAASASSPGIPLDGVFLPLTPDPLLLASLEFANSSPFAATLGVLEAGGGSPDPQLITLGLTAALAGQSFACAWLGFSLSSPPFGSFYASEARTVSFLP